MKIKLLVLFAFIVNSAFAGMQIFRGDICTVNGDLYLNTVTVSIEDGTYGKIKVGNISIPFTVSWHNAITSDGIHFYTSYIGGNKINVFVEENSSYLVFISDSDNITIAFEITESKIVP